MRRARDPKQGLRLPFDHDDHDREGSYRRPVALGEALRLTVKVASVVGAGIWFKSATDTPTAEGAKLAVAVGAAACVIAAVDLIGLRSGELERIFLAGRRDQIRVRAAVLVGGLVVLAGGLLRLLPV